MATKYKDAKEVYDKCLSIRGSTKDVLDFYDQVWAGDYDKDMEKLVFGGPAPVLKFVQKYVPDKNAKIIDILAGKPVHLFAILHRVDVEL